MFDCVADVRELFGQFTSVRDFFLATMTALTAAEEAAYTNLLATTDANHVTVMMPLIVAAQVPLSALQAIRNDDTVEKVVEKWAGFGESGVWTMLFMQAYRDKYTAVNRDDLPIMHDVILAECQAARVRGDSAVEFGHAITGAIKTGVTQSRLKEPSSVFAKALFELPPESSKLGKVARTGVALADTSEYERDTDGKVQERGVEWMKHLKDRLTWIIYCKTLRRTAGDYGYDGLAYRIMEICEVLEEMDWALCRIYVVKYFLEYKGKFPIAHCPTVYLKAHQEWERTGKAIEEPHRSKPTSVLALLPECSQPAKQHLLMPPTPPSPPPPSPPEGPADELVTEAAAAQAAAADKWCHCKPRCPPAGSDTPHGSHNFRCKKVYEEYRSGAPTAASTDADTATTSNWKVVQEMMTLMKEMKSLLSSPAGLPLSGTARVEKKAEKTAAATAARLVADKAAAAAARLSRQAAEALPATRFEDPATDTSSGEESGAESGSRSKKKKKNGKKRKLDPGSLPSVPEAKVTAEATAAKAAAAKALIASAAAHAAGAKVKLEPMTAATLSHMVCNKCGQKGHLGGTGGINCRNPRVKAPSAETCARCGGHDHVPSACPVNTPPNRAGGGGRWQAATAFKPVVDTLQWHPPSQQ